MIVGSGKINVLIHDESFKDVKTDDSEYNWEIC